MSEKYELWASQGQSGILIGKYSKSQLIRKIIELQSDMSLAVKYKGKYINTDTWEQWIIL
jgi:hypothetical protein